MVSSRITKREPLRPLDSNSYFHSMCTVTYLPSGSGFIFTSSRDESPLRAQETIPPDRYQTPQGTYIFPKDLQGGTWFGLSESGRLHCLLNGAFVRHKHQPPYRKSRGLVLLESLSWDSSQDFAGSYDFGGIEPFTMIMIERTGALRLTELRWDGSRAHVAEKDTASPAIWSSAALYRPEIIQQREMLFRQWTEEQLAPAREDVLQLHLNGSIGDPENDFRMNRNGIVQTVSITQLHAATENETLHYSDLLHDRTVSLKL